MKTIISVANMNALDGHVVFALDITDALIQRVREAVEFLKDKEPNIQGLHGMLMLICTI